MSELSILVLVVVGWIVISVGGLFLYPQIKSWRYHRKWARLEKKVQDHLDSN